MSLRTTTMDFLANSKVICKKTYASGAFLKPKSNSVWKSTSQVPELGKRSTFILQSSQYLKISLLQYFVRFLSIWNSKIGDTIGPLLGSFVLDKKLDLATWRSVILLEEFVFKNCPASWLKGTLEPWDNFYFSVTFNFVHF